MTRQRCEEVMRCYLTEVVAQGKLELIDGFAAEDMVDHTQTIRGPAALKRHVSRFRARLDNFEIVVERIVASDDEVVGIWRLRTTHSMDLWGLPATGKPIEARNVSVFRLQDGMLVDYEVFSDSLAVVRQLGAEIRLPAT